MCFLLIHIKNTGLVEAMHRPVKSMVASQWIWLLTAVVLFLLIVCFLMYPFCVRVYDWACFCGIFICVLSSFAIISQRKRVFVALL